MMHSVSEPLLAELPQRAPAEPRQSSDEPVQRTKAQLSWLQHDIQHEVATITLLAEVVAGSPELAPESRHRLEQLANEAHWLNQLVGAYHDAQNEAAPDEWRPPVSSVRVDLLVGEVLAALSLTSGRKVRFVGQPGTATTNRLCMWRALRNLLDNAFRAAAGLVEVSVTASDAWVTVAIDDDGPGFGKGPKGLASLGLGIVQDYAVANGGRIEVERSRLGGCRVRLLLPGTAVPSQTVPSATVPSQTVPSATAATG